MNREIEFAKIQLLIDQTKAMGITDIKNDGTYIVLEPEKFYQLFREFGSNRIKSEFIGDRHVMSEVSEENIRYVTYYSFRAMGLEERSR